VIKIASLTDHFVDIKEVKKLHAQINDLQVTINQMSLTHVPAEKINEWKEAYWQLKQLLRKLGIGIEKNSKGKITVHHDHDSIVHQLNDLIELRKNLIFVQCSNCNYQTSFARVKGEPNYWKRVACPQCNQTKIYQEIKVVQPSE
jgi:ssDNA-binding Zn-finger/Zn-ribbon topoisomerase 1